MIKRYRRKPETVEAVQYTYANAKEIVDFADGWVVTREVFGRVVGIDVFDGDGLPARLNKLDYIVKEKDGTYSVWQAGMFKAAFEETEKIK